MTLTLNLEKFQGLPLHKRVTLALIDAILRGELQPGEALPSSRKLAKDLAISRCTVSNSYEVLISLGLAETTPCKSIYVSTTLQTDFSPASFEPIYRGVAGDNWMNVCGGQIVASLKS